MIWNENTLRELIGSLLWNTSEYLNIPLGRFAPIIFGWMIGSKGIEIKKEYRIPTIDEFIQGFEFEVRHDYKIQMLDLSGETKPETISESIVWAPSKVTWKATEWITEEKNGMKYHISPGVINFFEPFDVESFLEQGLIRVKL